MVDQCQRCLSLKKTHIPRNVNGVDQFFCPSDSTHIYANCTFIPGKKEAVRIEIEYDDGSVDFATGKAAEEIKTWYDGAEGMYCFHGAVYKGTKFQTR